MGDVVLDVLSKYDRLAKTKNDKIHRKLPLEWNNEETDKSCQTPRPKKTQIVSTSCLGLWCKDDDFELVEVKLNVPVFHRSSKKELGDGVGSPETPSNISSHTSRTREFLMQACSVPKQLNDDSSKISNNKNTYTGAQGRSLSLSSFSRENSTSVGHYKYPLHKYQRNGHREKILLHKIYHSNKFSNACVQKEKRVNVQKEKPAVKESVESESSSTSRIPNATSSKTSKNSTVSIEVSSSNGEAFAEFIADTRTMKTILKQYPKLRDLIPEPKGESKNAKYSLEAVKCLLSFLFSGSCNIVNWKVALEVYTISQFYAVAELQSKCHNFFVQNPITSENAIEIISYANYFGIKKELLMLERFLQEDYVSSSPSPIYTGLCTIATSTYLEPSEFTIPLTNAGPKSFDSLFPGDIKNDLEIESFRGSFRITGIQIKLEPDNNEVGEPLKIFCDISNTYENIHFEETREKSLNSLIVINFRSKLVVKPDQKAMISVVIDDLKPALCSAVEEDSIKYQSYQGIFRMTIQSNRKLKDSKRKRCFIEKIFYTIRKEAN